MPDLSPSPSDETNTLLRLLVMRADNNTLTPSDLSPPFSPKSTSIIVNCLLYASLSCSLLAAVGAMMAKEWLQSFDRSGQTGPLEDQGKLRQRKFNGVEEWHLEAVIKFLPNLLLLSVILFFAGIGLFLFPINTAVAGTVIAFSGLGVVLSGIAIIAGAISPLCPYQSAASNAVRRTFNALFKLGRMLSQTIINPISRTIIHPILQTIIHPILRVILTHGRIILLTAGRLWMQFRQLICPTFVVNATSEEIFSSRALINHLQSAYPPLNMTPFGAPPEPTLPASGKSLETDEQIVTAQAAGWLLHTTSIRADQVAVARFIRSLNTNACTLAFEDSRNWRRLLSLTCEALDVFDSQPSEANRELAEAFGLALCHVPLPLPEDMLKGDKETVFDPMPAQKASELSETFLHALDLARSKYEKEDGGRVFHMALLFTLISRDRMIKEYQWANLSKLFPVDEHPRPLIADSLLGMWAHTAYSMSGGTFYEIRKLEELMEIGGNT
ncbi:hypothetical protein FRC00_001655 [Tulasnella sp. 408]|nr:hypothetical protein FRC00_001655 [Tulasnella sp. 408]